MFFFQGLTEEVRSCVRISKQLRGGRSKLEQLPKISSKHQLSVCKAPGIFHAVSHIDHLIHYDVIVDVVGCRKWQRWSGQRSTFSRTCRRLTELRTPCNATVSRRNARLLYSSGSTRFNPSFHLPFQNLSTTLFMTSCMFSGDHADDSGGSAERDDGGEPR